jgi:hypothetical protein
MTPENALKFAEACIDIKDATRNGMPALAAVRLADFIASPRAESVGRNISRLNAEQRGAPTAFEARRLREMTEDLLTLAAIPFTPSEVDVLRACL